MIVGPFRLDIANQCLWRGAREITLTPKPFTVLRYLLENPARLVSKEELLEAVWHRHHVSDAVLKVCVQEIRRALEDDPRAPRYIETRHRLGYRFIGKVAASPAASGVPPELPPLGGSPCATRPARLVGREAALAELRGHLDTALRGQRQVLFVTGEAGIGKTTVVEAFLAGLAEADTWIARGQCLEQYAAGEAYLPVLEAFGWLCRTAKRARLIESLRHYAPTWLAQMHALLSGAEREALKREILGATRERMLREMSEVVEALAAGMPLVLVLEDLHCSDYATLDLIASLARRQAPARFLFIGTYRPGDVLQNRHPLQTVKQELQLHDLCAELPLAFLSEAAIVDYVAARFPESRPPAGLTRLIRQRTEGNPLFMVNVLNYLVTQGLWVEIDGRWQLAVPLEAVELGVPQKLRPMIERQIERLSRREQRTLEAASVAGLGFSAAQVAAALEQDLVTVEECCAALARREQFLEVGGFVEYPNGQMAERYAFLHAFYRDIVYQRIAAARRARFHQRIAEHGEGSYGDRAGEIAADLALHFEAARDHARALRYLREAADNAARRFANREAIAYLTRALQGVEHLPETERDDARLAILEQRALVRRAMGYDVQGAVQDFSLLAGLARDLGRVEYQIRALVYLSIVLSWTDLERCLATAEQAVELSRRLDDSLLRAHARGVYGHWHSLFRHWRMEDVDASAEALEAATGAGDRALMTLHSSQYACFQFLRSEYRAACVAAERGMQFAFETGDAFEYMLNQFYRALALLYLGRWGELWRLLGSGIQMAEKNAHPFWAMLFRLELAWLHLYIFDFGRARLLCEQCRCEAWGLRYETGRILSLILLGNAHAGLEEQVRAHDCFAEASALCDERRRGMDWLLKMPLHHGLSGYHLARGDFEKARREGERVCQMAAQPGERTWLSLGRGILAEIALAERDDARAGRELSQALAALRGVEAPIAGWRVHAAAARLRERQGHTAKAERAWAKSAAILNQLADSLADVPLLHDALSASPVFQAIVGRAHVPKERAATSSA